MALLGLVLAVALVEVAVLAWSGYRANRRRRQMLVERLIAEQRLRALTYGALAAMRAEVRRQQRQG